MSQKLNNAQNHEDDISADNEQGLEANLRAALYRHDCPTTMELGEYQLGFLVEPEALRVKAHLGDCPHCQAEFSRLIEFLAVETVVSAPTSAEAGAGAGWKRGDGFEWQHLKEAGQVIIRLIGEALNTATLNLPQGLQPAADRPAFGRLRGSQPLFEVALREEIDDFEAVIIVDTSRKDPTHCAITVEVNILSRGGWPNLANTEVKLKQNEVVLATQVTNAYGRTVFSNITTDELTKLNFEITPS